MHPTQILVVEDEPLVAKDLQQSLIGLGYAVPATVSSGMEAIAKAREIQPDLVLMDIVLKGTMNGIQAASYIGAQLQIPVVYLTAYASESTLEQAKATDPVGYLQKPFQLTQLRTAVEIGLNQDRSKQRLRETKQWLASTLQCMGEAVIATNLEGRIRFMNPAAETLTGWVHSDALDAECARLFMSTGNESRTEVDNPLMKAMWTDSVIHMSQVALMTVEGSTRLIDGTVAPLRDEGNIVIGAVLVCRSSGVVKHDRQEGDRAGRIAPSGGEAKRVEVLVPICAGCKQIRDVKGTWHRLETYFQEQGEISFTHGMCPDCLKQWYPRR